MASTASEQIIITPAATSHHDDSPSKIHLKRAPPSVLEVYSSFPIPSSRQEEEELNEPYYDLYLLSSSPESILPPSPLSSPNMSPSLKKTFKKKFSTSTKKNITTAVDVQQWQQQQQQYQQPCSKKSCTPSSLPSSSVQEVTRSCLCGRGVKCSRISSAFFMLDENDPRSGYQKLPLLVANEHEHEHDGNDGNDGNDDHGFVRAQVRKSYLRRIMPQNANYQDLTKVLPSRKHHHLQHALQQSLLTPSLTTTPLTNNNHNHNKYIANHHFHPILLFKFLNFTEGKRDLPWMMEEHQLLQQSELAQVQNKFDHILNKDGFSEGYRIITPTYKFKDTKKDLAKLLKYQQDTFVPKTTTSKNNKTSTLEEILQDNSNSANHHQDKDHQAFSFKHTVKPNKSVSSPTEQSSDLSLICDNKESFVTQALESSSTPTSKNFSNLQATHFLEEGHPHVHDGDDDGDSKIHNKITDDHHHHSFISLKRTTSTTTPRTQATTGSSSTTTSCSTSPPSSVKLCHYDSTDDSFDNGGAGYNPTRMNTSSVIHNRLPLPNSRTSKKSTMAGADTSPASRRNNQDHHHHYHGPNVSSSTTDADITSYKRRCNWFGAKKAYNMSSRISQKLLSSSSSRRPSPRQLYHAPARRSATKTTPLSKLWSVPLGHNKHKNKDSNSKHNTGRTTDSILDVKNPFEYPIESSSSSSSSSRRRSRSNKRRFFGARQQLMTNNKKIMVLSNSYHPSSKTRTPTSLDTITPLLSSSLHGNGHPARTMMMNHGSTSSTTYSHNNKKNVHHQESGFLDSYLLQKANTSSSLSGGLPHRRQGSGVSMSSVGSSSTNNSCFTDLFAANKRSSRSPLATTTSSTTRLEDVEYVSSKSMDDKNDQYTCTETKREHDDADDTDSMTPAYEEEEVPLPPVLPSLPNKNGEEELERSSRELSPLPSPSFSCAIPTSAPSLPPAFKYTDLNSMDPQVIESVELLLVQKLSSSSNNNQSRKQEKDRQQPTLANPKYAQVLFTAYGEWRTKPSSQILLDRYHTKLVLAYAPKIPAAKQKKALISAAKCCLIIADCLAAKVRSIILEEESSSSSLNLDHHEGKNDQWGTILG